ncbi:MAG: hypothetical protein M1837_000360 [Sclerophora amabilis]|nr:MAG: hypothetical protein M1837_000360 [Sclerophora amabilis]
MNRSRTTTTATTANTSPRRSRSPNQEGEVFSDDHIAPTPPVQYQSGPNSTYNSRPASTMGSSGYNHATAAPYFRSRRVQKGEIEKPWLTKKDPKEKWVTIIPIIGLFLGLCVAGFLVWDGLQTVVNNSYKLILDEDFSGGLDPKVWTKEREVGGFGNGQFEETTTTEENAFVKGGQLWIQPTLQNPDLINKNNVLNLTKQGACSSDVVMNCVSSTNVTNGTIRNPVKSARLNTKKGAAIKYGRVEVKAKLPTGDWLWPAIWMMPVDSKYGPWPLSGEIDILESRGNNYSYAQGGNNIATSALHWGPNAANDGWWKTNVKRNSLHSTYSDDFHTFGLEWSEKYLFTYIDTRLLQVLYTKFDSPLWDRGNFPLSDSNGTRLVDPWKQTGRLNTPFDTEFYLILNVAVGGTNGWFEDGMSGKPWVDTSPTAAKDFWDARNQWSPTWKDRGQMIIDSVKIWQQTNKN